MSDRIFEGIHNIRDLGGIPVEGGCVQPLRLLRSSRLSDATPLDREVLSASYHLEQIIDLRTPWEIQESPDQPVEGAAHAAIPLLKDEEMGMTHGQSSDQGLLGMGQIPDMEHVYAELGRHPAPAPWRSIFALLLAPRTGAVLWHCTEGKDRCGMVTALVLFALGASREAILADYLKTNTAAAPRAEAMAALALQKTGNAAVAERVRAVFVAKEAYFHAAFGAMEEAFGSVEGFLEQVCEVDGSKREALRKRYCQLG